MNEKPSALLRFLGSARLAWANILGFLAVPGCFDVMATDPKLRSLLEHVPGRHGEWVLFGLVWLICFLGLVKTTVGLISAMPRRVSERCEDCSGKALDRKKTMPKVKQRGIWQFMLKAILTFTALVFLGAVGLIWHLFLYPKPHFSFKEPQLSLLLREAELLVQSRPEGQSESLDKLFWPPAITSLKPQFVSIDHQDTPFVDVQLSGGFDHAGLFLVCDPKALEFVPSKSNWRVRKLKPRVFFYEESKRGWGLFGSRVSLK